MTFIQWCNDNNGFLTAILSIIGLLLSVIAIVVSIHTARLPYKKKILLGSSLHLVTKVLPGVSADTFIKGLSASATNIGNRPVSLTYLGYAIKKEGRFHKFYTIKRELNNKANLTPSEMLEVKFETKELIDILKNENQETKVYVFANDTEGTEYKKRIGTVGNLLKKLSE